MRGTHQGEWREVSATGNKFEMSGIGILRIENGKIVELREEPDRLGRVQQGGSSSLSRRALYFRSGNSFKPLLDLGFINLNDDRPAVGAK